MAAEAEGVAALLVQLFNEFPTPILVSDAGERIAAVNPAAGELLGGEATLMGVPLAMVLPGFGEAPPQSESRTRRESVVTRAGERLDLEVRTLPLSHNGRFARIHILHDITPYTELSRMREQLLHDVAHELNGPIGTLENALALLREEGVASGETAPLLDGAVRTAARLRTLMGDLLTAGTIQSGRLVVVARPVAVAALLDEAADAVCLAMEERGQRIARSIGAEVGLVLADRRHVVRVLTNLLSNAAKYSPPGAVIELRVTCAGALVRFDVSDEGPGIPSGEQARLFSRYYRPRPRDQTPGIGLGLAIARGVVEAHGGTIGIESVEGVGTRVWFCLPEPDRS